MDIVKLMAKCNYHHQNDFELEQNNSFIPTPIFDCLKKNDAWSVLNYFAQVQSHSDGGCCTSPSTWQYSCKKKFCIVLNEYLKQDNHDCVGKCRNVNLFSPPFLIVWGKTTREMFWIISLKFKVILMVVVALCHQLDNIQAKGNFVYFSMNI